MLQIQPLFRQKEQWEELTRRENLCIEVLELSAPPLLGHTGPEADACKEWYRESGRVESVHGAFIDVNPASGDPEFRSLSRRRCRESCALAAELGAKNVVFHSSCFPFLRGGYLDGWAASCGEFFTALAADTGLNILIENSPDVNPDPLVALMAKCGSGVSVCLDAGHAAYSGTPLQVWLEKLGVHIGGLHLSDNLGEFDDHLPLGEGVVELELLSDWYCAQGRELPITLEVGGIEGVERSLALLKREKLFGLE